MNFPLQMRWTMIEPFDWLQIIRETNILWLLKRGGRRGNLHQPGGVQFHMVPFLYCYLACCFIPKSWNLPLTEYFFFTQFTSRKASSCAEVFNVNYAWYQCQVTSLLWRRLIMTIYAFIRRQGLSIYYRSDGMFRIPPLNLLRWVPFNYAIH